MSLAANCGAPSSDSDSDASLSSEEECGRPRPARVALRGSSGPVFTRGRPG